ncbi:hypothetical protein HCJ66_09065 [Listeria sp. FSL L7-1582]|uniref:hypothetical protein n=1 Tax=Listeria portnoyi TaxID=2713504 RepID=UPI00164D6628|nr:hypothetical protein [Listeria portnoyi]MBC6309708.1 hypothetical protein [Listeria portnoyi]
MKKILLLCTAFLVLSFGLAACGQEVKTPTKTPEKTTAKAVTTRKDTRQYFEQSWKQTWKGLETNIKHVTVVQLSNASKTKMKTKDQGVIGVKMHVKNTTDQDMYVFSDQAALVVDGKTNPIFKNDSQNITEKLAKNSEKDILLIFHIPTLTSVTQYKQVILKWAMSTQKDVTKTDGDNSKKEEVTLPLTSTK